MAVVIKQANAIKFMALLSSFGSIIAISYLAVIIIDNKEEKDKNNTNGPNSLGSYNLAYQKENTIGISCAVAAPEKSVTTFLKKSECFIFLFSIIG